MVILRQEMLKTTVICFHASTEARSLSNFIGADEVLNVSHWTFEKGCMRWFSIIFSRNQATITL